MNQTVKSAAPLSAVLAEKRISLTLNEYQELAGETNKGTKLYMKRVKQQLDVCPCNAGINCAATMMSDVEEVARANINKLQSRADRGTLSGNGDER